MGKYNSFNLNQYSVHTKIIQLIGNKKKVLDVGCAEGKLSERMKLTGCEIVGIESDKDSGQIAQKVCREVIHEDVELLELSDEYEKYFDFIIFADVLEHLKDPLNTLIRLKRYLKDDGSIIVSLPNIANWRIRLKLLCGNFDYQEKGILDKTHLRFFNEKTAKKIIDHAGFDIIKFDLTVGDLKIFPVFFHFLGLKMPNLLAYQFLIVAKKS